MRAQSESALKYIQSIAVNLQWQKTVPPIGGADKGGTNRENPSRWQEKLVLLLKEDMAFEDSEFLEKCLIRVVVCPENRKQF